VLAAGEARLLEADRAFAFSARGLDERTVEARFVVADGYYLYRDKLRFRTEPVGLAAAPALPPGRMKHDDFFGDVETYRGALPVRLALDRGAPGQQVTVVAESQGCADAGVCYPVTVQRVTLQLPAAGAGPGAPVDALAPRKQWFR
jgi:thiol:disulfide interchange protein DsbD